jgi:hypothetical protein
MALKNSELCYLLAFPDLVEGSDEPHEQIRGLKDAPYFQPVDISVRSLGQSVIEVTNAHVNVIRQRYDDCVQVVETRFSLGDPLSLSAIQSRAAIESALQQQFVPAEYRESGMFEEYVVLLLPGAKPAPDKFLDKYAIDLARFIRSQREAFDPREIQNILSSRVRYSKDNLTLVDWQAAVIIAPEGDFQSDIELLKIGNYQLLRYRRLDQSIETSLRNLSDQFRVDPRRALRAGPTRSQIRRIVQHRLDLMLEFEHTEQYLLLIGDWYTAQLYHAIREEFYLESWKEIIKGKLDNLENIIQTMRDNFSLSWSGLMENISLAGWIILLIGYFILFFLEASGSFRIR